MQAAAKALTRAKLELGGKPLEFDASAAMTQLFLGNVSSEWGDVAALRADLEQYGAVERAFIMHNPEGLSKVLAQEPRYSLASWEPGPSMSGCSGVWHCQPGASNLCIRNVTASVVAGS